jgi:hypothetical protein
MTAEEALLLQNAGLLFKHDFVLSACLTILYGTYSNFYNFWNAEVEKCRCICSSYNYIDESAAVGVALQSIV